MEEATLVFLCNTQQRGRGGEVTGPTQKVSDGNEIASTVHGTKQNNNVTVEICTWGTTLSLDKM